MKTLVESLFSQDLTIKDIFDDILNKFESSNPEEILDALDLLYKQYKPYKLEGWNGDNTKLERKLLKLGMDYVLILHCKRGVRDDYQLAWIDEKQDNRILFYYVGYLKQWRKAYTNFDWGLTGKVGIRTLLSQLGSRDSTQWDCIVISSKKNTRAIKDKIYSLNI